MSFIVVSEAAYAILEAGAKREGLTVDEYVNRTQARMRGEGVLLTLPTPGPIKVYRGAPYRPGPLKSEPEPGRLPLP